MMDHDLAHERGRFNSYAEFDEFKEKLQRSSVFESVPRVAKYVNALDQDWFIHIPSGDRWMLIRPDGPYAGDWTNDSATERKPRTDQRRWS